MTAVNDVRPEPWCLFQTGTRVTYTFTALLIRCYDLGPCENTLLHTRRTSKPMSAVIYPVKSVRKGQRTKSPQYADRNLDLVWGKIRDAGIYAAPLEHQLDYGVYRQNLSAWLQATATASKVPTGNEGHSLHGIPPEMHQVLFSSDQAAHCVLMAETDSMTALNAEIDSMIVPLVP